MLFDPLAILRFSGAITVAEKRALKEQGFDIAVPSTPAVQSGRAIPHETEAPAMAFTREEYEAGMRAVYGDLICVLRAVRAVDPASTLKEAYMLYGIVRRKHETFLRCLDAGAFDEFIFDESATNALDRLVDQAMREAGYTPQPAEGPM